MSVPQTGWRKQQKCILSQFQRPKSGIKVLAGEFLLRPHSLACDSHLSLHLYVVFPLCIAVYIFPVLIRIPLILGWDPSPCTNFNLISLKTLSPNTNIFGSMRGLGLHHMSLGVHNSAHSKGQG